MNSVNVLRIAGTGSRGVLVENLKMDHKIPKWDSGIVAHGDVVYKISTDGVSHAKELKNAMYLRTLDPLQRFFLYPIKTYEMSGDPVLLKYVDQFNKVPNKQFNTASRRMYIDVLPYGGSSPKKLKKEGMVLTPKQAKTIIRMLIDGLELLHQRGIVHGDAHEHNVVIQFNKHNDPIAKWIDFGEMRQNINMQGDVKKFIHLIKFISNMTSSDDQLDALVATISRGAAPMTAMGLKTDINNAFSTKRSRSSARSSSADSAKKVTKKLNFGFS